MEKNKTPFLHYIIALAPILLSLWNLVTTIADRNKINPFTPIGWIQEQVGISYILLVVGLCLLIIIRKGHSKEENIGSFVVAELGLAAICVAIFLRYFWPSLAVLTLLTVFDAAWNVFRLSASQSSLHAYLFRLIAIILTCTFCIILYFASINLFATGC